ncbi:Hypothetical protein, putative, partial [Bodo saltans]
YVSRSTNDDSGTRTSHKHHSNHNHAVRCGAPAVKGAAIHHRPTATVRRSLRVSDCSHSGRCLGNYSCSRHRQFTNAQYPRWCAVTLVVLQRAPGHHASPPSAVQRHQPLHLCVGAPPHRRQCSSPFYGILHDNNLLPPLYVPPIETLDCFFFSAYPTVATVGGALGIIRARDTGNSPTRSTLGGVRSLSSSYRELPVTTPVPHPQFSATNPFTSALGLPRTAGNAVRRLGPSRGGAVSSSVDSALGAHGILHDNNLLPPLYVPPIETLDCVTAPRPTGYPESPTLPSPHATPSTPGSPNTPGAAASPRTTPLQHRGAVCIVFDLDETLCNNRRPGKALLRPHTMELLHHLHSLRNDPQVNCYVELVLWTASMECVARPVVERIDPTGALFQHRIYRDRRWYKETGYTKDLKRLGREMHHTVIIENSPASVHLNRKHSILVKDFVSGQDTDLVVVKEVLDGWIRQVGACARALQAPPPNDAQAPNSIVKFLSEHPNINSGNEVVSRPSLPPSRNGPGFPGLAGKTPSAGGLRGPAMQSIGLSLTRVAINRPSAISRGRLF